MTRTFSSIQNSNPIGIFDSGVGGLSIAKCISEQLPNEQLFYVADSKFAPYGDVSVALIEQRVNSITNWLVKKNVKAIVVACNTATVNVIEQLRAKHSIPIIGVEPAIKPAAKLSRTKNVGILVTQATSQNQRFLSLIATHKQNSEVHIQPCPGLVELVESGNTSGKECNQLLDKYLSPLITKNIDTLVLGCTHYPFLTSAIRDYIGENITIMETALPVTEQLERRLKNHNLLNQKSNSPSHQFFSSKTCIKQAEVFSKLFQKEVKLTILNQNK